MEILLISFAALFIAYFNGSNDNIKGVATLYGSGVSDYRNTIIWGTFTTATGSLFALVIAKTLILNFSGKGLVPDQFVNTFSFNTSIALGAGAAVLIASQIGMPISTTHSIIGAMIGSGFVAAGSALNLTKLFATFFVPLLFSPIAAVGIAYLLYLFFNRTRLALGYEKETCVCAGEKSYCLTTANNLSSEAILHEVKKINFAIDTVDSCSVNYSGKFLGIKLQSILTTSHFISSGLVSFARGLNDTPKLLGLFIFFNLFDPNLSLLGVTIAMMIGGLLNSRKVAETMGKKITPLNDGQGFTANLSTSLLVLASSFWGLPVSTTHVSVGSLFGIGMVTKKYDKGVVKNILYSWLLTLPVAAIFGGLIYFLISNFK